VKAVTHTEVYRRFEGRLRSHPLRFFSITRSALRVAVKKKLPLLLLYAPPTITCIVFSFIVYGKFSLESGQTPFGQGASTALAAMAANLIEVSQNIIDYVTVVRFFALLVMAWYGAGLVSEDRRLGAHLLYFSRPITRMDYLLGKFFACAAFGALAVIVPTLVICSIAAFASPNWSFVTKQGHVIVEALEFTTLWVVVVSMLVLSISSLVERKTLALVAFFAWIMLTEAVGRVLAELSGDERFFLLGTLENFEQVGSWIFGRVLETSDRRGGYQHRVPFGFPPQWSLAALAVLFVLSFGLLVRRLRRLEVVA
jgi:ABC-type transport system involved in multi-copper enzyme maturation permease subunit